MGRSSSHGPYGGIDGYARPIKFRVRHGWRNGVSLAEALGGVKLDDARDYTFDDLNVDGSGRMLLRVRWAGYRSLTYEIPVSGFDGRVHLQSLARRIARSVEHFLTSNYISIAFDRVILHRLEETSYGTWTPILTTS
ncbi:uncharacterized protein STEHIDRAFT_54892 [Stereum hirsutum FP-91666 SS1]|uniref:uncharacterized protein n=1 Tax=Stereum hirsutum (strain FP-91666) TaxID=721885 RepID=UPI0004410166|nr:uncharacterized protein STEHIDRAFT_54892 [Stereum hirsutum FP-91666 SS1]EIM88382.1 hypothetical protein STEHIDRAFT_54892 [Stereum hirsutum FP-91666 SS1]